jgi:arylsulfatase A-like enzyme
MQVARRIGGAAAGGAVTGAALGLLEALYHAATAAPPDRWALPYAMGLYGLVGLGAGIGAGFGVVVLALVVRSRFRVEDWLAPVAGAAAATVPVVGFVGYYLANKEIYLEQGVPMVGKLALLGGIGALVVAELVVGRLALQRASAKAPWFGVAGAALLGVALVGVAVATRPADPRAAFGTGKTGDKPDILFVMVDTLRADALGTYGAEGNPTPTLDALAADGVVFEQAFSQASWTRASGASLFTSRLPCGHGAATKAARLGPDVVTWAEALQGQGYATGALINNINLTSTFGFDQGFDRFLYEEPAYPFGGTESVFGLTLYKVVHKLGERFLGGHKEVTSYYQPADVVLADARSFVEQNDAASWALFVHLMEPHDPYFEHPVIEDPNAPEYNGVGFARAEVERPKMEDAPYLREVYADEVRFLDRKLAPFVAWLKESGRYDQTMIVLTADHGEEFGEHGGFWHGTTLYDEQINVPLIVKLPGGEHAGTHVPWQVRSIDVAPTLAEAAGASPDPSWDGRPLVADVAAWKQHLVDAETARIEAWKASLPIEVYDPADPMAVLPEPPPAPAPDVCAAAPFERAVLAEEDFEGNVLAAIRKGGFKLHRANEGNPRGLPVEALFQVAVDADEAHELLAGGASVCAGYPSDWRAQLAEELGETLRTCAAGASEAGTAATSAAECERLKALGYVAADEPCE